MSCWNGKRLHQFVIVNKEYNGLNINFMIQTLRLLAMGTIWIRVEAMANDSRVKVLELCMSMLVQYHMNLLKFYELLLLRHNILLMVLTDGAVGCVNQSLRNMKYGCKM